MKTVVPMLRSLRYGVAGIRFQHMLVFSIILLSVGIARAGTLRNYDFDQYRVVVTFISGLVEYKIIARRATVLGLCSFAGCQLTVVETGQVLQMGPRDSVVILNGRATVSHAPFPLADRDNVEGLLLPRPAPRSKDAAVLQLLEDLCARVPCKVRRCETRENIRSTASSSPSLHRKQSSGSRASELPHQSSTGC